MPISNETRNSCASCLALAENGCENRFSEAQDPKMGAKPLPFIGLVRFARITEFVSFQRIGMLESAKASESIPTILVFT